jgi:hypothetical protein
VSLQGVQVAPFPADGKAYDVPLMDNTESHDYVERGANEVVYEPEILAETPSVRENDHEH